MLLSVDKLWLDNGWVIDCMGGGRTVCAFSPRNQERQLFRPPLWTLFICHQRTAEGTKRRARPLGLNLMLGRSTFSTARQKMACVTSPCIYTWTPLNRRKEKWWSWVITQSTSFTLLVWLEGCPFSWMHVEEMIHKSIWSRAFFQGFQGLGPLVPMKGNLNATVHLPECPLNFMGTVQGRLITFSTRAWLIHRHGQCFQLILAKKTYLGSGLYIVG